MIQIFFTAFLAAIVGDIVINSLAKKYQYPILKIAEDIEEYRKFARYIGMTERALYVFAWFLGYPEFLAIWLVFKVAIKLSLSPGLPF